MPAPLAANPALAFIWRSPSNSRIPAPCRTTARKSLIQLGSIVIVQSRRSFRRAEGFEVEEGSESGLGDISLLGRFVVYAKPEHEYSVFLSLLAGLEFPTGDSDRLLEEANETEVPGAPPSGVHGNDLALG